MRDRRPTLATVRLAARRFGADPDELRLVNAGVNTVYRAGGLALRLRHQHRNDRDYLDPPLAWLRHLHAAGAWVCGPVSATDGAWIVELPEDDLTFLATAVRWVDGPRLSDLPPTPELYQEYGRSVGRLHRAGQGFQTPPGTPHMLEPGEPGVFPRWDWLWGRAARHAGGIPVLERAFERLTPQVLSWAAEETAMTHGDLRPGNVIWNEGRAVIIDFDEPVLGPAALDLARAGLELAAAERPSLLPTLMAGYRQQQPLDARWDARLPALMAARAALVTAWSLQDGQAVVSESGSGGVVSAKRLLERLERWDF
ncbi:phosphotransferase enzyme family protein [Deinococcus sp.]|uniref:phosphotransferase enzyme family protein n=1 Tax=Deinococcus sp. TaxID=47478 RepID=UPI003C7E0246